jgi:type I restriction enzyme S subunit
MEELIALGDIASIARGTINPNLSSGERFIYYSIPGYDDTGGALETLGKEIQSNKTLLEKDCVLISKLNPRIPRVCYVSISERGRTICSTEFIPLVPRDELVALEYLTHYLRSSVFQERFQAAAGGSTNSHSRVTPGEILDWEVFIPPLPEQKKIAEILSGIDTGIYYHKARSKKCEELIAATEASTFDVFRKDDLNQQDRAERNGKEAIPLGDIFEFRNGLNYSKANTGKGLKVVGVGDFKNYRTPKYGLLGELSPEGLDFNSSLLEEGDFLFVRSNGNRLLIGRCLSIEKIPTGAPVVHSGFTIRARPKNQHAYSNDYIKQLLQSRVFQRSVAELGGGTNISNLSQVILSETIIALPSIQRQEKESSGLLAIQEFYEHTQNKLIQMEALKVAVSSDLLSGRKRVSV